MYKILSRDWSVLLATILLMVNCHSDMTLREQIESMRSSTKYLDSAYFISLAQIASPDILSKTKMMER